MDNSLHLSQGWVCFCDLAAPNNYQHFAPSLADSHSFGSTLKLFSYQRALTNKYIDNEKARNKLLVSIYNIPLFTEYLIKELHEIMASSLLPRDSKVKAGNYRIDSRMVGDFDVIFPSPELIQECMNNFIIKSNELTVSAFKEEINIFEVAAMVSHAFVRIHPFPDFNGRISRIILMIILMAFGVPFPVTLRGNKKCRKRYLYFLKKANNGYYISYATLIAMRVAELFKEIEQNIFLAGLPTIKSFFHLERVEIYQIKY